MHFSEVVMKISPKSASAKQLTYSIGVDTHFVKLPATRLLECLKKLQVIYPTLVSEATTEYSD